jgi:hypothetical protein
VVHGSEVTLLITLFVIPFVMAQRAIVSSIHADVAAFAPRAALISSSAAHYAPTFKNSRSTRRERRNQHSTCIIV